MESPVIVVCVHKQQHVLCSQVTQPVKKSSTIPADTPVRDDAVRFVCVSDTHNRTDRLRVPPGDVLLHAGDFSMTGQMREVEHFNAWLGRTISRTLGPFWHARCFGRKHHLNIHPNSRRVI